MNNPTIWWLVAGALVALELTTGTFYLLMLALGAAAGAVVAHAGAGFTVQVVVAAAVGGLAVVVWNAYRQRQLGRAALLAEQRFIGSVQTRVLSLLLRRLTFSKGDGV